MQISIRECFKLYELKLKSSKITGESQYIDQNKIIEMPYLDINLYKKQQGIMVLKARNANIACLNNTSEANSLMFTSESK